MSDLVGKPENGFSRDVAQMVIKHYPIRCLYGSSVCLSVRTIGCDLSLRTDGPAVPEHHVKEREIQHTRSGWVADLYTIRSID